ncbi:MAG: alpha-galactosidase [Prevotella sp.]|jgi:hypothetical protein|nr:alpha-galactosidase [Prevotella sp.]
MNLKFSHILNALLVFVLLATPGGYAQNKKTPMMGWSSWNTFRININEDLIKETADAMVAKGLKDAGYTFVNIDDGFFYGRDEKGNLLVHPEKFPNGMKAVADHIHKLGLKAGIYSDVGIQTCGSIWDNDKYGMTVGLWGHEERDADLYFNQWGYDYIKVDYCGGEKVSDEGRKDEEQKYKYILETIKKTAKKDIRFNVCRWQFPGTWVGDSFGSWRIFVDISEDFNKSDRGVIGTLEKNMFLAAYASPGHFNDMDMMQLGRGTMNENEEMSHFGIWCIMSSPLMIGCDLRTIPESTLKIITNKEVIAINQDVLGMQAQLVSRTGKQIVLAKPLEKREGKIRAVALVNAELEPKTMRVSFRDIQLDGSVKVRDLWQHKDLGKFQDYFEVEVPAHGTAMLKLEGERTFDKTIYEAEYTFLNEFIGPDGVNGKARPTKGDNLSGGAKLGWLGNSATNWAEFRDIYSSKGGRYKMNIYYLCDDERELTVTVNGKEYKLENLKSGSTNTIASTSIDINLKKGQNVIRLSNDRGWTPDIDKIELVLLSNTK